MAKKYYAVRVGKTPGIYLSWDDCKAMVDGFPGAKYKGFTNIAEAEAFLEGKELSAPAGEEIEGDSLLEGLLETVADLLEDRK